MKIALTLTKEPADFSISLMWTLKDKLARTSKLRGRPKLKLQIQVMSD